MQNFWIQIRKPFLALAPMAGITDQPFRLVCKSFGVDILYSEMISSEALFHNVINLYRTLKLIQFLEAERPFVEQIFGADPEHMAYAAEYISSGRWNNDFTKILNSKFETLNKSKIQNSNSQNNFEFRVSSFEFSSIPNGIDVNMGCPARDVVKTGAGAALLKNPQLAEKIIKAIKKKVKNIPVSVKTRIGWSDSKNILTFLRILECAGVDAIAIHGRTVKQGFSGEVDWETIYKIKKQLKIPVIGNGNITINSQLSTNQLGLDGIMIGQGVLGKPWLFEKLKTQSAKHKTKVSLRDNYYNAQFIKKTVLEHAELVERLRGKRGIIEFRKHLGWYFSGMPNAKQIRRQLVNINSLEDVRNILNLKCKAKSVK